MTSKIEDAEAQGMEEVEEEEVFQLSASTGSLRERLYDVMVNMAPLGLVAFGGPLAHIAILQVQFVERRKWLDADRFVELMAVGQGLPGPTSTQMVIAIGATRAGIPGGLLAFAMWNAPGFIVLVTVGILAIQGLDGELPDYLIGLPAAATSLIFIAAYSLGTKICQDPEQSVQNLKTGIALASTIATILITGDDRIDRRWVSVAFPAFLVLGGLLTLADSRREGKLSFYFTSPTAQDEDDNKSILKNINMSRWTGALLIVIWVGTLVTVIVLKNTGVFAYGSLGSLFEIFFRIGSIIYGGGPVVLPLLQAEVVPEFVTNDEFLIGFGFVSSLPGPLFNFSSFIGAVSKGIVGAFVAWIGLFSPGILLVLAFLPFWVYVRRVSWFRCFLAGVNSAAIGLIIAACVQFFQRAVFSWATVCSFFLTGALIQFYKVFAPLSILCGGLLGFILSPTVANFAQGYSD